MKIPSFFTSLADKENQVKELKVIRVRFIVTFLVWILCFVSYMQGRIPVMTPFNIYFILATIVNFIAKRQFLLWENVPFTKYCIITFDIIFFTMVIYFTGGENSPFIFLYMLEIAGVTIFSNIGSSIFFAVMSIMLYIALIFLIDFGIIKEYPIIYTPQIKINELTSGLALAFIFKIIILVLLMSIMIFLAGYVFKQIKENEQKLEEKNSILSAINRITRRISAKLTLEELYKTAKFETSILAPIEMFIIGVFANSNNITEIIQDNGNGKLIKGVEEFKKEKWGVLPNESSDFNVIAQNKDEIKKLSLNGFLTDKNLNSYFYIPLITGDKNVGFLSAGSKKENAFDTNFIEIMAKSATPLAVAIEKSRLYDEIKELSIKDHLTNIYNRRYFIERLAEEISRSARYLRIFSLIIFDIDNFKEINDTSGHLAGDKVIKSLISSAKKIIRDVDILARYGGDEFVIIMPEIDSFNSYKVAERIREAAENINFDFLNGSKVTVSIGISSYPKDGETDKTLISSSDIAMYKSKERGKNRVTLFTKE